MKLELNTAYIFIICSLTISCAVIQDVPRQEIIKIEKTDFAKLNGQFPNFPTEQNGIVVQEKLWPCSIWSQIEGFREYASKEQLQKQLVSLEFISEKKAIATLWENGVIKNQKTIHGKIQNGYFYRRPHFYVIPLVPLFWGYKTFRYRIGLTNNSILIDNKWNYWLYVLLGGDSSKGESHSRFEKK